jgi:hypothetical protein
MPNQNSLRLVTYCGLYCGLCAQRTGVPQQALQLQQTLHEEGFDDFYRSIDPMRIYDTQDRSINDNGSLLKSPRKGLGVKP